MSFSHIIKPLEGFLLIGLLTACGGGGSDSNDPDNNGGGNNNGIPPIAVSKLSINLATSNTVTLDASSSYDLDGSITDFQWSQTTGPQVTLNNAGTMTASFTAPSVTDTTELLFTLTLTDNDSDTSSITVSVLIQPPVADFTNLTGPVILSAIDTLDIAQNIAVRGDYAYVADWESGLKIIDVSDSRSPQIVAVLDTRSRAWDVTFSTDGDIAFVADQDALYAINISDPTAPFIEDETFGDIFGATAVFIEGNRLYASGYDSFTVMDVSDPADMKLLGSYEYVSGIFPSNDLEVVEGIAYLARYSDGLLMLDAQDPEAITRLGGFDSENFAERLVLKDDQLFMTDQDAGTKVINVSNPELPQLVSTIPLHEGLLGTHTSEAHSIKISGDTAYIGTHYGTFQLWDITNVLSPAFLGEVATITQSTSLDVSGSLVYIVGHSGFNIIDVSAPVSLQSQADFIRTESSVSGSSLIIEGNTVYDVTDPTDPVKASLVFASAWNPTFGTSVFSLDNGNSMVNGSLNIYDFSDFSMPVVQGPGALPQLTNVPANSYFYSSQLEGNILFTAYRNGEFQLIDTSDPLNLVTRQLDLSAYGYLDVWGFHGDYVYAVDNDDMAVVDISDLANPTEVGSIEYSGKRIMVDGNFVYMTGFFDFRVYDMSTPATPELVVTIPTEISNRMARVGDFIFIGLGQSGSGKVMVVDVSLPEFPAYTHLESGSKTVEDILVNADAMVTSSYDADAIRVFDISPYFP